ncbi:hypothetical protein SteCoe_12355 [Stentor coeruleus]|uniref:RCC1-like domain-containing protein n=1 Tax=Stentor coeruleus TaxID=5963 RepID=A0A1R2CAX9_9CILI|nr:hypothetical protein SteCoe_12355 [Stentor coeruleus]
MEDFTEVFVWGSDQFGQLGLGNNQHKTYSLPRFCSFNILIKSVSCGDQHSGFISSEGHIYTMGSNLEGRLGISDLNIKFSSSPCLVESLKTEECLQLSCGGGHTIAIMQGGNAYAWGQGDSGALGLGSLQNQWSPVSISLPMGVRVLQVSCGSKHSSLIVRKIETGVQVLMSGTGDSGQLGTGKREKECQFVAIKPPEEILYASCGVFHSGFLSVTGKVYTTGGNSFGQLGLGNKKGTCVLRKVEGLDGVRVNKILCSGHSAALTEMGDVYVWGTGIFGEFVVPYKIASNAQNISLGSNFTIIIDENFSIYSWGNNINGELGVGDFESKNTPTFLASLQGKKILQISSGNNFTIALGEDILYKSNKRKSTTPLRYSNKTDTSYKNSTETTPIVISYEQLMEEKSRKTPNQRSSIKRHLQEKNTIEKSYDKKYFDIKDEENETKKKYDMLYDEIYTLKNENQRLVQVISSEQAKNKKINDDKEELGAYTESLKKNLTSLQRDLLENQAYQIDLQRQKVLIEEAKHQAFSYELENTSLKEELKHLEYVLNEKEKGFIQEIDNKLRSQASIMEEGYNKKLGLMQSEMEDAKVKARQIENNLNLTSNHNTRLEEALNIANMQTNKLSQQIEALKDDNMLLRDKLNQQIEVLKDDNMLLRDKLKLAERDKDDLMICMQSYKDETLEKEAKRDCMIKLIEEKVQELEDIREQLVKERDSLNRLVSDQNLQLSKLNQKLDTEKNSLNRLVSDQNLQLSKLNQKLDTEKNYYLSDKDSLSRDLNDLNIQLIHYKDIEREKNHLEIEKENLTHSLNQMSSEILKLNNVIESERNFSQQEKDSLTKEINQLNMEISHMQSVELQRNSLANDKITLSQTVNELSIEVSNMLRVENENNTLNKDKKRLIKEVEDLSQKLENMHEVERLLESGFIEKDNLNRVISDLTLEISRLNAKIADQNHQILVLEEKLAQETAKTSGLMIDLETAKEEIVILELKNMEIFETLQKELAQRAKDYKERTINLLNNPNVPRPRSPSNEQNFTSINKSPSYENKVKSPNRQMIISEMPSIDLMGRTPRRETGISKAQQEKIAAAAWKMLQRPESPLKNMRVSSPSRKSPERPVPYSRYYRSTPDIKKRSNFNV